MFPLKNKKILVTGAGGFIGSHLCESLVKEGAKVRAFLLYNKDGALDNLEEADCKDQLDIFFGDLQDSASVRKAMQGMDVVFHLGALISIPYSYVNPRSYVNTNIIGTFNVLEAAKDLGLQKVIITSTSEVYGSAEYVPMDEKHTQKGQSPYSASKIAADKLAESFYYAFNLPVTIIRPFNTYGPRQSMRAVIPTIIVQALKTGKVELGNTRPTRDLNFVKDTVNGFIKIAKSEKSTGETINIGSGSEISIGDLAKKIVGRIKQIEKTGKDIPIVVDKKRIRPESSEVTRLLCSNEKAKRLLDWEQEYDLDRGLTETILYIKKRLDFYSRPGGYKI